MITKEEALAHINRLKKKGLKVDVVGGLHKGHGKIHDLDILSKPEDVESNKRILRRIRHPLKIEMYVASPGQHRKLKKVLRTSTYEVIKGKKMKGMKFKKHRFADNYEFALGDKILNNAANVAKTYSRTSRVNNNIKKRRAVKSMPQTSTPATQLDEYKFNLWNKFTKWHNEYGKPIRDWSSTALSGASVGIAAYGVKKQDQHYKAEKGIKPIKIKSKTAIKSERKLSDLIIKLGEHILVYGLSLENVLPRFVSNKSLALAKGRVLDQWGKTYKTMRRLKGYPIEDIVKKMNNEQAIKDAAMQRIGVARSLRIKRAKMKPVEKKVRTAGPYMDDNQFLLHTKKHGLPSGHEAKRG